MGWVCTILGERRDGPSLPSGVQSILHTQHILFDISCLDEDEFDSENDESDTEMAEGNSQPQESV